MTRKHAVIGLVSIAILLFLFFGFKNHFWGIADRSSSSANQSDTTSNEKVLKALKELQAEVKGLRGQKNDRRTHFIPDISKCDCELSADSDKYNYSAN